MQFEARRSVPPPANVAEALTPRESLEALIARHGEGSIPAELRREAMRRYEALPLPELPHARSGKQAYAMLGASEIRCQPDDHAHDTIHPNGVFVTAFRHARAHHPALFENAFRQALGPLDDTFTALAFALQSSGRFMHVPAGVVVDEPLLLTYDTSEQFPYTLVFLGEGAQATIIEEIANEKTGTRATICGITEVVLADRARLTYATLQQSGKDDHFFMTRRARCGADAHIEWALAELGGCLARTTLRTGLNRPGASADIVALFFADKKQRVDLAIDIDHIIGPTSSRTVIKSAAAEHGIGRAWGTIRISPAAHGAEASLRDDALLLSQDAHIDAIPALEIAANDVKAYHGATVGSIDEEEFFYAMSRGIPQAEAERMITLGFFEPVVERFPTNALRERIRITLAEKLGC
jgi:Fe-S cluster assembly protein SufD